MPIEHSELVQLALESSPSGILMTNADGVIVLVNKELEKLFRYSREELIGRRIEDLIPERFRPQHPAHRAAFYASPDARRMGEGRDLYGLRSDGSEVPVEIGLNPVLTQAGPCVLASVVDISARREAENRLRESQKMEAIGTLAGGIAHDFNNILLNILGYTELSRAQVDSDSDMAEDLDHVIKAAMRGKKLVERILAFSRHSTMEREVVDACKVFREALGLLRASLPTTISIRETIDEDTPQLLADETALHQVVMNLATNAVQAMPDGGVLDISLGLWVEGVERSNSTKGKQPAPTVQKDRQTPGSFARIRVADNGMGMSTELLERIFEPYFTTKPPGQGSGLGLSIIRGIVESLRGRIFVESELGKGTCIDVYLPAAEVPQTQDIQQDSVADTLVRGHIIAVDDEVALAKLLNRHLTSLGFRVSTFHSSLEALACFKKSPDAFDLMITDNTMPKMTGLELVKNVRDIRADIPVVFISGHITEGLEKVLGDFEQITALKKPYSRAELEAIISQVTVGSDPA